MLNNFKFKSRLLQVAFGGFILFSAASPVVAQTETEAKETRKVRVKMLTEINGKQTLVDTVMEITGTLGRPELKELSRFRTEVRNPGEIQERIKIIGPEGKDFRSSEEIQKLIDQAKAGSLHTINADEIRERILKDVEAGKDHVKIYRQLEPGARFKIDSAARHQIFMFKNNELTGKTFDFENMPADLKVLHEERFEKLRELRAFRPIPGDSGMVFKRIIIIQCDEDVNGTGENMKTQVTEEGNSKVKNLELENADLYPNPTNGIFNLSFEVPKKINTFIAVLDAVGKEVYRENLKHFKGRYQKEIDLRHLPKGMYFVQINQGKHVYNKKLLLQ